jgi:hypothetical protein
MKRTIAALALAAAFTASATAQQYASSDGYRVCAPSATEQGISVAAEQCGTVKAPNFSTAKITSERDLRALIDQRDTFRADVKTYGQCITQLINSYRRPGAPADSLVPDQAACAHSWAEDQATKAVRELGKACIDYSNRSIMDARLKDYTGACYPSVGTGQG